MLGLSSRLTPQYIGLLKIIWDIPQSSLSTVGVPKNSGGTSHPIYENPWASHPGYRTNVGHPTSFCKKTWDVPPCFQIPWSVPSSFLKVDGSDHAKREIVWVIPPQFIPERGMSHHVLPTGGNSARYSWIISLGSLCFRALQPHLRVAAYLQGEQQQDRRRHLIARRRLPRRCTCARPGPTVFASDTSAIYSVMVNSIALCCGGVAGNRTIYVLKDYNAFGGLPGLDEIAVPVTFV
ncbi:hypothetical protein DFH08DRAFT_826483 [Mycena albidolilacea]|uniref:Uncharacterized protein n=1 Tax=Mycena albidolilacea TaxID=1033008 RepID=A0AAD6Z0N7_9AGAR|nr:hypothetical protein DFH08DRAFT_826483 [Mycena albidolilacea]